MLDLMFRVWGVGSRIWGLGFGSRIWGLGSRMGNRFEVTYTKVE